MLPLAVLPNGGNASFCTNSSEVHVETDGIFEVVPFDHAQPPADRSYNPTSTNAQSGTAVAEAFSAGSAVESFPDSPAPYTLKQGAAVQLSEYTETLQLTPCALATAQEMRVLYTPAVARTTPLIAVPDGVTLHWAGDAEPTWEAGNNYVIQLLQIAPTRIEARLFNAPQGAKLPDWMTDDARGYVAWSYDATGKRVPIAANVDKQLSGLNQFAGTSSQDIGTELSALLADATFADETEAAHQFAYISGTIYLPKATFANVTSARYMFQATETVILPQATFESAVADAFTSSSGSFYLPRVTFRGDEWLSDVFTGGATKMVYLNAYAGHTYMVLGGGLASNDDESEFHLYSFELPLRLIGNSHGKTFVPSATWRLMSDFKNFKIARRIYCPHLNLIRATNAAPDFWRGHGGISIEELRQVVYGPKLVDDGAGGLKMGETTYRDENGIVQMIAPPEHTRTEDVYTPLVGEPLYTYDWGDHLYTYLEGERLLSNGNKPTGWGIQDFRKTDATGAFVLDAEGNYTYKSTGHTIAFDAPVTSQGDADYEACLVELENRGWVVEITYI